MSSSSAPRRAARWASAVLLLLSALLARPAAATHIRAGDIQARSDTNNLLNYSFILRLYLDDINGAIDEPIARDICFGDGTFADVPRNSKTPISSCLPISENVYRFTHTFPGPGTYTISFVGNNRNGAILNLGPSPEDLSIYISTTITISAAFGPTNSAIFSRAPVDQGAAGRVFEHTPGVSEKDKDSLSFSLIPPRQGPLSGMPCSGWSSIPGYSPLSNYSIGPGLFTIHPQTGVITWNAPASPGEYNIAYKVTEWRRLGFGVVLEVGSSIRDMQITITGSTNQPPVLTVPADTCVVANTQLTAFVSATDPNGHPVRIESEGGPFMATPQAVFPQVGSNPVRHQFRWTPDCEQVSRQPYPASFSARDTPPNCETQLTTSRVWRIRVVGPAPQRLVVDGASRRQIRVHWNLYECRGAADSIRIYRRENSSPAQPTACQTGIPAAWGYQYVGSVAATDTVFFDNNGGRTFKRGSTYCYRVYATWPLPGLGESLASNEACATIPGLLPHLINATVDATAAAAGQVTVKWTKGDPGPLPAVFASHYRLSRAAADAPTAFAVLRDRIPLSDTTYVDAALNTEQRQFIYRLELVDEHTTDPNLTESDTAALATTARLSGTRAATQIDLTWAYAVPWDNTTRLHYIYRRINGTYTLIDSVQATATGGAYTDRFTFGEYRIGDECPNCYRIRTRGTYVVGTRQPAFTRNLSQEICVRNEPTPPVLTLEAPDCAAESATCPTSFENRLNWSGGTDPECPADVVNWRLYFQTGGQGDFTLLETLPATRLSYTHTGLTSRLGCYAIAAVDSSGAEGPRSTVVCQDNCELFALPNVISPNGDGRNDTFEPICASPTRQVKFAVFNRWGTKVYEGDGNPRIQWPGTGSGGNKLADGIYFYRADVTFDVLSPTPRAFKGWVQIAGSRESGSAVR